MFCSDCVKILMNANNVINPVIKYKTPEVLYICCNVCRCSLQLYFSPKYKEHETFVQIEPHPLAQLTPFTKNYTVLYRPSKRDLKHSLSLSYTNNKAMAGWSSSTGMDVIDNLVPGF